MLVLLLNLECVVLFSGKIRLLFQYILIYLNVFIFLMVNLVFLSAFEHMSILFKLCLSTATYNDEMKRTAEHNFSIMLP